MVAYLQIAAAVVVGVLGFWLGHGMASGACAKRELAVATAYADWGKSALEGVRASLEAERKRAVLAAEARGRKAALSQGVIADATQDLDRSCEWRDPHRLRIEALYTAYGMRAETGGTGMRATLPGPTADDAAARVVGAGGAAVGAGVQSPAR